MYQVFINNGIGDILIYDNTTMNNNLKLANCKITKEINKIQNMTFEIFSNHMCFDMLHEFTTQVKVYNTISNIVEFKGRILSIDIAMESSGLITKSVQCESELGYLCDSIQPYKEETQYNDDDEGELNALTGLQKFLKLLLDNHNAQVEEYKKIYMGDVDVVTHDSNNGVYKGLNYQTTWNAITDKLIKSFKGELQIRHNSLDGKNYLDYKQEISQHTTTTIELSKNIKSLKQEYDSTKIITRLIPLGAKLKNEDGKETEERLTIEDLTENCVNYIEDETYKNLYGVIYNTVIFEDVTDASNLLRKGQEYLISNNKIDVVNNVDALNLYSIGLDINDFILGNYYVVKNSLIGINEELRVIKINIDVLTPQNTTINLGDTQKVFTDQYITMYHSLLDTNDKIQTQQVNTNNTITEVNRYIETSISDITQTTSNISLRVDENTENITQFGEFNQTVSNILDIQADGTSMIFENIIQSIEDVNGEIQTNYKDLIKYIRFENGNIVIGNNDSQLTLTIENDKIAFRNNGIIVSYWDMNTNMFQIGNIKVDVNERAQFGNFAFIPRSDGSLSFLKVQ